MALTQLNPQIPLITEKGNGQAIAVIDYSEEHDLMWVVVLDDTGEVWTFLNSKVRGFPNYTSGRKAFENPFKTPLPAKPKAPEKHYNPRSIDAPSELGATIKQVREELQIDAERLADFCNMSGHELNALEAGDDGGRLGQILAVFRMIGLKLTICDEHPPGQ